MAIKVRVKNFQSIKDSEISIDGFTVVTGANNSGKTALMRAIRGVFTNARGHSFVRHGASHCEVELTFEDGNSVLWEKGKNVNRYTVNGKVLNKVGHGVPPEVEALGVCSITAGAAQIWPQIARQFEGQLFLMNQPGSTMADAVADADRVGQLQQALKLSESDRRKSSSELKLRDSDRKDLESELEDFEGLNEALVLVDRAENIESKCEKMAKAIRGLEGMYTSLLSASEVVSSLEGISHVDTSIDTDTSSDLKQELHGMRVLFSQLTKASSMVSAHDGIEAVKAGLEDYNVSAIDKLKTALYVLIDLNEQRVKAQSTLDTLTDRLTDSENELVGIREEISTVIGDLGECPMCGVSTAQHKEQEHCYG